MKQQVELLAGLDRRMVEGLSARHQEPEWLRRRRLEAWRVFEEAPMPDAFSEEWRRFDTTRLTLDGLLLSAEAGAPLELPMLWDQRAHLAGGLLQRNSAIADQALDNELARQGVIVSDLHAAAREHPEIVREHLFSAVSPGEWKYLALHGALWSGGCLVYVPQGIEVELPIAYVTSFSTPRLGLFPHLLVVAEANSRVTVIQEGVSPALDGLNVVAGAVEVVARPGAQARFVDLQRWGAHVQSFVTMRARLSRDASFQATLLGLGGALTKSRLDVRLEEAGARAELLGLFFGKGDQQFHYDTRQDHVAPHTESDLLFKSALDDRAHFVWDGVVDIRPTASQSSANQTSRNLLLSDQAGASPTPVLEISAYDVVRCSHGASVGPVDEEQLFYLQARGIPPEQAEHMLVEAFFSQVLERVQSGEVRHSIEALLIEKSGWERPAGDEG